MASPLSGIREELGRMAQAKRDRYKDPLDQAMKYAQLAESGYQLTPQGGNRFGLSRDPNANTLKDLQRQKLQAEVNRMNQPAFGSGSIPENVRIKEYDQFGQPKSYEPKDNLTAGQRLAKDKATADLFETVNMNEAKTQQISEARNAMSRVPQGMMGALRFGFNKYFDPNDPMLSDFQKIRMIGTDAQLMNTAKTKGAISDREMALFAEAAANDDFISVARMKPVLDKLERFIEAEQQGKFGAYQQSYGEDPRDWFKDTKFGQQQNNQSFNSPEEADASGLPPGTIVTVQGRRYQI